jgi:DNA-binding response OmpR family regulator
VRRPRFLLRQGLRREAFHVQSIVIVTTTADRFRTVAQALSAETGYPIQWLASADEAVSMVAEATPPLMVIDEQVGPIAGLDLVRRLLPVNAFVNTVLVSGLSEEDFHEAAEGLGVLARLPHGPHDAQAATLTALLRRTGVLKT